MGQLIKQKHLNFDAGHLITYICDLMSILNGVSDASAGGGKGVSWQADDTSGCTDKHGNKKLPQTFPWCYAATNSNCFQTSCQSAAGAFDDPFGKRMTSTDAAY